MLQFANRTGFAGSLVLSPDPSGVDTLYATLKGTFDIGDTLARAGEQVPVALADEYHGDPTETSIRVPSDFSLNKPGTDILLLGHACAPGDRPVRTMEVGLSLGPVQRKVRVFGDRYWEADGIGYSISQPEPFLRMPLIWERAYGGVDRVGAELRAEVRNPVGTGYRARDGEKQLDGLRLPNLENPAELITSWKQQPTPFCFAPLCPQWEPRRSFAGTYDVEWQSRRAPYLPEDFDARFFQLAPPGLTTHGYLEGGEQAELVGLTPDGHSSFRLPTIAIDVGFVIGGRATERRAVLDTVIIEPDRGRVLLVWRASLQCDKRTLQVSEVVADIVERGGEDG